MKKGIEVHLNQKRKEDEQYILQNRILLFSI